MAIRERSGKLYRSKNAMIFGVCQGISDWMGINASTLRIALVLLTIFTGFFPLGLIYLAAALLLRMEPAYKMENNPYYSRSFKKGYYDLKRDFEDLSSKMYSTRKDSGTERDWDQRFKEGR